MADPLHPQTAHMHMHMLTCTCTCICSQRAHVHMHITHAHRGPTLPARQAGCEHNCVPVACPPSASDLFECSFPSSKIPKFCDGERPGGRVWHPLAYRLAGCKTVPPVPGLHEKSISHETPISHEKPISREKPMAPQAQMPPLRRGRRRPSTAAALLTRPSVPSPPPPTLPPSCSLSAHGADLYLFSWLRIMDGSAADADNNLALLGYFLRYYLTPPSAATSPLAPSAAPHLGLWPSHASFVVQDPASSRSLPDPLAVGNVRAPLRHCATTAWQHACCDLDACIDPLAVGNVRAPRRHVSMRADMDACINPPARRVRPVSQPGVAPCVPYHR